MKSLLFTLALLAAGTAHADRYVDRPWSGNAVLSVGAPTGSVGAELNRTFAEHLELGLGGGFNGSGAQAAGMARLRMHWETLALHGGLGWSLGKHEQETTGGFFLDDESEVLSWERAHWMNVEVGMTWRRESGAQVRVQWGLARMMNVEECVGCAIEPVGVAVSDRPDAIRTDYVGVSVGQAF